MASCEGKDHGPNFLWAALFPYVIWPFSNIFMTASLYMTVVISIDRYIVVCFPYYACERESIVSNPQWLSQRQKSLVFFQLGRLYLLSFQKS